jgi:hypothetical protein
MTGGLLLGVAMDAAVVLLAAAAALSKGSYGNESGRAAPPELLAR